LSAEGRRGLDALDEQLLDQLVGQAKERGVKLAGEGGLLAELTKRLLESALDGEITDHLGHERHDGAGDGSGNSRNGKRSRRRRRHRSCARAGPWRARR